MRRRKTLRTRGVASAASGNRGIENTPASLRQEQSEHMRQEQAAVVALIDPKPLTRVAIKEMLSRAFPGHKTVAVSDCDGLLELKSEPHLVILYIRTAGIIDDWVKDALRSVRTHLPNIPMVVLSDRDDADEVFEAFNSGARGYIPTSVASAVAFAALNLIDAGGTFIPEFALRPAKVELRDSTQETEEGPVLTPKELLVMKLLRLGEPNKAIALKLNMQQNTVKVHVRNIMKKLNVHNRTQAATVVSHLSDGLDNFRPHDGRPPHVKA